jgi:hypothetical protein
MRINSLKCKKISLMNGSDAGHSKKNILLSDLYTHSRTKWAAYAKSSWTASHVK